MREKPADQEILPRPLVRGTWVRIAQSAQGHKVGRSLDMAICGRTLEPEYHEWIVEDLRKASHCGRCKGKDFTDDPDDDAD